MLFNDGAFQNAFFFFFENRKKLVCLSFLCHTVQSLRSLQHVKRVLICSSLVSLDTKTCQYVIYVILIYRS